MKKMFTKNHSALNLCLPIILLVGCFAFSNSSYGQTYYSTFTDPTGRYSKTDPSDCDAPAIQNVINIADSNLYNFASFEAMNISAPYVCTNRYLFDVDLNLAGTGSYFLDSGNEAGFRINVPSGINKDSLGKYLTVTTYLRDSANPNNVTFQEYSTGGGSSGNALYGLDVENAGVNWLVYFTTTKPFNLLELAVDPQIIQLNTDFVFDVYYAFGGTISVVLPAQIANFKAAVSGKSVNLSWQSLTETNVSNYRIERSSNNGVSYSPVATLPAKGNSNIAVSYGYTDHVTVDGNYLYRIVIVNKDGSNKMTGSLPAIINGQAKLLLYPTVVKAGQIVTAKTSEKGLVTIYLYDAQGRMVKQQRTASTGQFSIATNGLSTGVYNVKIITATGSVIQAKIVINQ